MGSRLSLDDSVRVVIVGGGFGGTAAASQLKAWAVPFVLVDMLDAFHHNVAALRASVESGKGRAEPVPWACCLVASSCTVPRGSEGKREEQGKGGASPALAMMKCLTFSTWKTSARLGEVPRTVCGRLTPWLTGKMRRSYPDALFYFFLLFFKNLKKFTEVKLSGWKEQRGDV